MLAEFKGITDALVSSTSLLRNESIGIQSEISEALVQLQFQDRVAQILSHVKPNIERLPDCLGEPEAALAQGRLPSPLNAAPLLAELEGSYAMVDERQAHRGSGKTDGKTDSKTAAPKAAAEAPEEITFF